MQLPHLPPDAVIAAFERWAELLRAVDRDTGGSAGADAVEWIGWYALGVTDVTPTDLIRTFHKILARPEHTIMSTLDRTYLRGRAEGLAEGKAEGKAEGQVELLLRLLRRRFGAIDPSVEARLHASSREQLDLYADRVLDATTLAEVFDGPAPR